MPFDGEIFAALVCNHWRGFFVDGFAAANSERGREGTATRSTRNAPKIAPAILPRQAPCNAAQRVRPRLGIRTPTSPPALATPPNRVANRRVRACFSRHPEKILQPLQSFVFPHLAYNGKGPLPRMAAALCASYLKRDFLRNGILSRMVREGLQTLPLL